MAQAQPTMSSPAPTEVRDARRQAGLTQTEAAELVRGTLRAWQGWEASEGPSARRMHPGLWELFQLKTKS